VEERLFLSRIARKGGDVINRHTQVPAFVEPDLADPALAFLDQTAMPARVTLQRAAVEVFGQLRRTFGGHRIEYGGERC
jgi:hypothetical protein